MYQNNFRQLSKRPTNPSTKRATKKRPANQLSKQLVNQSNYISNNKLKDGHLLPPSGLPPLKVVTSCCMGKICNKGWKIKKCIVSCNREGDVFDGTLDKSLLNQIAPTKFTTDKDYFCGKDIELCIFDGDKVKVDYIIEVCRRGKVKVCYLTNICFEAYDYVGSGSPVLIVEVKNCETGAILSIGTLTLQEQSTEIAEILLSKCELVDGNFWECGKKYEIVLSAQITILLNPEDPMGGTVLSSIEIVDKCPCVFILSEDCDECVDEKVIVKDTGFPDNLYGVSAWKITNSTATKYTNTDTGEDGAKFDKEHKTICFTDHTDNQTGKVWIVYTKKIEVNCPGCPDDDEHSPRDPPCQTVHKNVAILKKCNPCACDNNGGHVSGEDTGEDPPSTDEQCPTPCFLDKDRTKLTINCVNLCFDFECFKKRVFDWCMCKIVCPQEGFSDSETGPPQLCVDYTLRVTKELSCDEQACVKFDLKCGRCKCEERELDYDKDIVWEVSYNNEVIGGPKTINFKKCSDLDGKEFFKCVDCESYALFKLKLTIPRHVFKLFCCEAVDKYDDNIVLDDCNPNEEDNIKIINPATVSDIVTVCDSNGNEFPSNIIVVSPGLPADNALVEDKTYNYKVCLNFASLLGLDNPSFDPNDPNNTEDPNWLTAVCEHGCILFKNCATLDHGITPETLDCKKKIPELGGHIEHKTFTKVPVDCTDLPLQLPLNKHRYTYQ